MFAQSNVSHPFPRRRYGLVLFALLTGRSRQPMPPDLFSFVAVPRSAQYRVCRVGGGDEQAMVLIVAVE